MHRYARWKSHLLEEKRNIVFSFTVKLASTMLMQFQFFSNNHLQTIIQAEQSSRSHHVQNG